LSHRIAFRLNRSLFDDLKAAPPTKALWAPTRLFLVAVSISLLLVTVAAIAGGLMLLFGDHQFGLRVVGFFLVLIGLELRPRWPSWKIELGVISRSEVPEMFGLVDAVADKLGAPRIVTIAVDEHWNASCGRRGLRREPALVIGLPLWAALSPAGRLALLGHELGHLINGDPARGVLTEPALNTFARIAAVFDPRSLVRAFSSQLALFGWLGGMLTSVVFTPIWWAARWTQVGLRMVVSRDHQRSEIYADAVAVRLAGTAGAAELFDALLLSEQVHTAVARSARRGDPVDQWGLDAAKARQVTDARHRVEEQASLREEASLFASHPPSGLRRRLIDAWPETDTDAIELINSDRWQKIDARLASQYRRVQRVLTTS
jgi:Zn-dependent protease with chaperone function